MSNAYVQLTGTTLESIDKLLGQVEAEVRASILSRSLSSSIQITKKVAKALLPKPGYPGDKPGLPPLRDAVMTKVKTYPNGVVVAMVGYRWAGGQHGHLVDDGHELIAWGMVTGRRTEGKKHLVKAVEQTEAEVNARAVRFVEGHIQRRVG